MSRDTEFLERWAFEKPMHLAWGQLVSETVQQRLASLISPALPSYFLRTPAIPRIKDDQKLLEKAYYRKNKRYTDPYRDITDKVGTRFVVLLGSEIRIVQKALTSIAGWACSKDRDYEDEQKKNPLQFDYSAVHFIVRPTTDVDAGATRIPEGTPCEVQIKTLLQHAYSELTHDTIYKPQIEATPFMMRNAAKAMALLEATNDYFEKVSCEVTYSLASVRKMTADLSSVFREVVGLDPKPSALEGLLLSAYEKSASEDYVKDIRKLFDDKDYIAERIKERIAERNPLFSQPSILLVYLSIARSLGRAVGAWPLTENELEPLLNDLGESLN